MNGLTLEDVVRKFDLRFDRIEQFLPTLATETELQEDLKTVKNELRAELETKAELQEGLPAVKADVQAVKADLQSVKDDWRAELATKVELYEGLQGVTDRLRAEIRSGDEETRRYMKMLFESLCDKFNVFAEGLLGPRSWCGARTPARGLGPY